MHAPPQKKPVPPATGRQATARPPQARVPASSPMGLPGRLKAGIESLSGLAMDDVEVHYNSSRPAQLQAFAYAEGTKIHVAPGQERHLPHEAWHVVQQKQGRVRPTHQLKGIAANNDDGLEREADIMGGRAVAQAAPAGPDALPMITPRGGTVQLSGVPLDYAKFLKPEGAPPGGSGDPPKQKPPQTPDLQLSLRHTVAIDANFEAKHLANSPEAALQKTQARAGPFSVNTVIKMSADQLKTRVENSLLSQWLRSGTEKIATLKLQHWTVNFGHSVAPTNLLDAGVILRANFMPNLIAPPSASETVAVTVFHAGS